MKNLKRRFLSLFVLFSMFFNFVAISTPDVKAIDMDVAAKLKTPAANALQINKSSSRLSSLGDSLINLGVLSFIALAVIFLAKKFWFNNDGGDGNGGNPPVKSNLGKKKDAQDLELSDSDSDLGSDSDNDSGNQDDEETKKYYDDLRDMGVSECMLKHVEGARTDGNTKYIRWETVDQFDEDIVEPVEKYQKNLKERLIEQRGSENNLTTEDWNLLAGFDPHSTCPTQVIRISKYANDFFEVDDADKKTAILEKIRCKINTKNFFTRELRRNKKVSWLSGGDIDRKINKNLHRYKLRPGSVKVIGPADLVVMDGRYILQESLRKKNSPKCRVDNFYQTFIISTADGIRQVSFEDAFGELFESYEMPEDASQLQLLSDTIQEASQGSCHYYVATIHKQGDNINYYIADTSSTHDHINDEELKGINKFICENITTGRSSVDYRAIMRNSARQKVDEIMQTMIEEGTISAKKKKKKKIKNK